MKKVDNLHNEVHNGQICGNCNAQKEIKNRWLHAAMINTITLQLAA